MLSSLCARRFTLAAMVSVAARTTYPVAFSIVARRTLFATPHFNFPSKASESTAKRATRKTAEKKESKSERATPGKRGRPSKKSIEDHKKQPKQEKQRVNIPKTLKPPKRAPGPYLIFYSSFVKSQPKASTLQETQELSKRASEIWRGYSMAERQPFYDENEARKARAKEEREEFFRNTSLTDLKRLNAIRKAQGKYKVRTKQPSRPVTPFILFMNEFRSSPEAQTIINETSPEKKYAVRAALAAGERWRSMSLEEKAPYFETFRKAKEELKTEQPQS